MELASSCNIDQNIHEIIGKRVLADPDGIAIRNGERTMTYKELWNRSGMLSNAITRMGCVKGDVIGILTGRCEELIVSILGVLRIGGIFLLIDRSCPADRMEYILENSCARLVLVKNNEESLSHIKVACAGVSDILIKTCPEEFDAVYRKPDEEVYILYTSGSTGVPKGVQVLHRGLTNYITWAAAYYCDNKKYNFPLFSAVGFDLTITSIFTPLVTGGSIILFESDEIDLIRRVIRTPEIQIVKLTPSHLNMITQEDVKQSGITKYILGGEALKTSTAERIYNWSERDIAIYNEYGPTEATVGCMIHKYDPEKDIREDVPLGVPIQNTRIFILDQDMKSVMYGMTGEIYISGCCLAKGYLNQDKQTAESFIENPYLKGTIMYKTGDLAKVNPGKVIQYIGRKDNQVKLRGYRIELGEIEKVLLKDARVKEAAVVVCGSEGNKYLAAFVTAFGALNEDTLKDGMTKMLPSYMIPNEFTILGEMPVTVNGKIDLKLLSSRERKEIRAEYAAPAGQTELMLAVIWKDILKRDKIGVHDNFFDMGGNSMLIVQLAAKIEKELDMECNVSELFAYPTISGFLKFKFGLKDETVSNTVNDVGDKSRDIAIIGVGCTMPQAESIAELWELFTQGYDFIGNFPSQRFAGVRHYAEHLFGEALPYFKGSYLDDIESFDADFFGLSPREADLMDPNQRIFLQTCWKAVEDAGYGGNALYGSNTGIYLGYGGSESEYRNMVFKYDRESINNALAGTLPSVISSRLSYLLNLKGPAVNFDTACSSSLVALHYACQSLYLNECEQALVGSIKIQLLPADRGVDIGISSKDSRTKSFDQAADGTVGGEGSIVLLIKPLKKAIENKDRIYAVVKGSALNQDGSSNGITAPNPIAQAEVIKKAWEIAKVDPETISMIEAHGTGTKLGDPVEVYGITNAFRAYTDKRQFCAIGSIKSNIGHLDNAAGLAGVLKAILCLKNKKLIPSIHFQYPNDEIDFIESPIYVNTKYRDWEVSKEMPRRCGVSSFGLSGTNSHVILEEPPELQNGLMMPPACILTISAKSRYSFVRLLDEYASLLSKAKHYQEIVNVCGTSNMGRGHYRYRMAIVFHETDKEFNLNLNRYQELSDLDNVFYGEYAVISASKKKAQEHEVTEQEFDQMREEANLLVKEYRKEQGDGTKILRELASLYVHGGDIRWEELFDLQQKVCLPVYPFRKETHWVSIPDEYEYFEERWEECSEQMEAVRMGQTSTVVVVMYKNKLCQNIYHSITMKGYHTIPLYIPENLETEQDLGLSVYEQIKEIEWNSVDKIIHILCSAEIEWNKTVGMKQYLLESCMSLTHVVRYISGYVNHIRLFVFAKFGGGVIHRKRGAVCPENAVVLSFLRTISLEYQNIECCGFDIDDVGTIPNLLDDGSFKARQMIMVRKEKCYLKIISKAAPFKNKVVSNTVLQQDGVYVIFGGTGKLGVKVAEYLVKKLDNCHVILVGRKNMASTSFRHENRIPLSAHENKLKRLIDSKTEVELLNGDISEETDINHLICNILKRYGKINGIFLCAAEGVGGKGNPVNQLSDLEIWNGIKAKTESPANIERAMGSNKIDFMVLFSSFITSIGAVGDAVYSAANSYFDAYAMKKCKISDKVITINWPTWMSTVDSEDAKNWKQSQILQPIDDMNALNGMFELLIRGAEGRYIIGKINHELVNDKNMQKLRLKFSEEILKEVSNYDCTVGKNSEDWKQSQSVSTNHIELLGKENQEYTKTEIILSNAIGHLLGYQSIDIYQNFQDLGINSILFVQVQIQLEKSRFNVSEQDFYQYNSVYDLAGYIDGNQAVSDVRKSELREDNIFNDVFYKSCFYHSLFSIIRMNGRSILPFLSNDIFIYTFNEAKLDIDTVSMTDEELLLVQQGIKLEKCVILTLERIKGELARNNKLIVWIDSFYESMRGDTFNKKHLAHTLAVLAYRSIDGMFTIIEHSGQDDLDYKICFIHEEELNRCIEGFQQNFLSGDEFQNYILGFDHSGCINVQERVCKDRYKILWNQKLKDYEEGIAALEKLIQFMSEKKLAENNVLVDLLAMIRNITNYKAVDAYRCTVFHEEAHRTEISEKIYQLFKEIRNGLLRLTIMNRHSEFHLDVFISQIREIQKMELGMVSLMKPSIESK